MNAAILLAPKVFSEKIRNIAIFVNFDGRSFEIAPQVHSNLVIANLCKEKFPTNFQPPLILFFGEITLNTGK